MMDGTGALPAVDLRRRPVVGVEAAAALALDVPALSLDPREPERLAEQPLAANRVGAVGARAFEALQRVLSRDLRRVGGQRLVVGRGHN